MALGGAGMRHLVEGGVGVAGLLFGIGLMVSGMVEPAKVQAFLDVGGRWDPSLALVMGGAIAVALPVFQWGGGAVSLCHPTGRSRGDWSWAASFWRGLGAVRVLPGPALLVAAGGTARPWATWLPWGSG
jgi:hypothetical protein